MKVNGNLVELGAMVYLLIQKEKYTQEIGEMIKHMAMENTFILMVQSTKVSGAKTFSMERVSKNGLTDQCFRELTVKERKMDWGNMSGLMGLATKESGMITKYLDTVSINGPMGESI